TTQLAEADKLSLVLKLPPKPGALHRALAPFARRGIDLLKIESCPTRGHPWQYQFLLDLQGALNEAEVNDALAELRACALEVRVLGRYPSAHSAFDRNKPTRDKHDYDPDSNTQH